MGNGPDTEDLGAARLALQHRVCAAEDDWRSAVGRPVCSALHRRVRAMEDTRLGVPIPTEAQRMTGTSCEGQTVMRAWSATELAEGSDVEDVGTPCLVLQHHVRATEDQGLARSGALHARPHSAGHAP